MVSSGMLRRVALVFLRSVRRLLVAACVVPSSPIFVTLMKEAPGSPETSVLTRATRRNNPQDTILHSHRRENLKSYIGTLHRKMINFYIYLIAKFCVVAPVFWMPQCIGQEACYPVATKCATR
jgi:hypothetical protein